MCIGIDHCSKKNCLEQERCLFPEAKTKRRVKINPCKLSKRYCSNERACYLIGCILENPLVKADKLATKQLKGKCTMGFILEVLTRLAPHLNKTYKTKRNNKKTK